MTLNYTDDTKAMIKEILLGAGKAYTEAQLKELPLIMNAKARYFWCTDLNEYDILRKEVFTEEFKFVSSGYVCNETMEDQIQNMIKSTGQGDMVPMHFGHNHIVQFLDETHARLLTRMNDYHTYKDNGDTYTGFGLYVDDLRKCDDGVWRFDVMRLEYGVMLGELRSMKQQ